MPREELTNAIKKAAASRGLSDDFLDRMTAFLMRAEEGGFPNREREEQLNLILNTLGVSNEDEGIQI